MSQILVLLRAFMAAMLVLFLFSFLLPNQEIKKYAQFVLICMLVAALLQKVACYNHYPIEKVVLAYIKEVEDSVQNAARAAY